MKLSRLHIAGFFAACALAVPCAIPAHAAVVANPIHDQAADASISMRAIGAYDSGIFNASAAEIVTYHAASKRVLTVNAESGEVDVLDVSDPTAPTKLGSVSGGADTTINSVSVRPDGLAVATVEPNADKTAPGSLIFFDAGAAQLASEPLGRVTVGALPDMVTITPDGKNAVVANEGEPKEDYTFDPEGSVSVITLRNGLEASAQNDVRTADFKAFNKDGALPEGVHIFGQVGDSTTVAQNLEPEYIAVSGDKAYVSLQENNAIAVVDLASATVEKIFPLGYQDRTVVPFDSTDRDGGINLRNWPIKSILQPDAVAAYEVDGQSYIVTANEGDSRDWEGYSEEARLKDFGKKKIAPLCAENKELLTDEAAGRLTMTTAFGLNADGTCYEDLYNFGGRSFSIFTADGERIFDSGADFEEITARVMPENFNSNHSKNGFDSRSDDKGPEPEGVTLGHIEGRTYAFIGLERVGGVIVYDITDPKNAVYQTYLNNRDFSIDMNDGEDIDVASNLANVGDLGPEGLTFIAAKDSPNGENLVVVGNEVSGTTTIFQVDSLIESPTPKSIGSSGSLLGSSYDVSVGSSGSSVSVGSS